MKKLLAILLMCGLASVSFAQRPVVQDEGCKVCAEKAAKSQKKDLRKDDDRGKQKRIQDHRKKQKRIQDHRKKQKRIGDSKDGVQRKGTRPLQQPKERGKPAQRGQERWNWGSRGSRMWGRNETPNQGGWGHNSGRKVQNLRMRFGNSVKQPSYSDDKGKNSKRGKHDCQCGSCEGTKSSPRKNPLQRSR